MELASSLLSASCLIETKCFDVGALTDRLSGSPAAGLGLRVSAVGPRKSAVGLCACPVGVLTPGVALGLVPVIGLLLVLATRDLRISGDNLLLPVRAVTVGAVSMVTCTSLVDDGFACASSGVVDEKELALLLAGDNRTT